MPDTSDLDTMTVLLTNQSRFRDIRTFEEKCRVMELTIAAKRNLIMRYK